MKIGVAMSGGGQRAAVWGMGTLAALVDLGVGRDIVSVASVSGGSIANGLAVQNLDIPTATASDVDAAFGPGLRSAANEGLFLPGPRTKWFVIRLLTFLCFSLVTNLALVVLLLSAGRRVWLLWPIGVGIVVALIVWQFLLKPSKLTAGRQALIVLAILLVSAAAIGAVWLSRHIEGQAFLGVVGALVLAVLLLTWLTLRTWDRRGTAVNRAMALQFFPGGDRPATRLDALVSRRVNHVFCATDLESADQFYLSPRFAYGYRHGVGDPGEHSITLATAVQASAALPLGFPPTTISIGRFARTSSVNSPTSSSERIIVCDGGVYDNMADQWESGFSDRATTWTDLPNLQDRADILVVANASGAWAWQPFPVVKGIRREIIGLKRSQGIQYDVSTSYRRHALLDRFRLPGHAGIRGGVFVMIDRSPFRVAEMFAKGTDERATRARQALAYLEDSPSTRSRWDKLSVANAAVPTTLGRLGRAVTLALLEHAYVLTVVNLYVIHGLGSLKTFEAERFEQIMGGLT